MRKTRDLILIMLLLLPFSLIAQNTYYVSSSEGSDSNSGKSAGQAWKSLEKVNSFRPNSGDQILFKKGDQWEGTLTVTASGTSGNPITYGSYGTGQKPVIYGSKVVTGWTKYSGNIYKATFNSKAGQFFVGDQRMQLARTPNSSYLTTSSTNGSTTITCSSLDGSIDYSGAIWFGRTTPYNIYSEEVSSSSSNTITLKSSRKGIAAGEGFILTNKLEFLDKAGEWYYDDSKNILYFYPSNATALSSTVVRASTFDYGIVVDSKNYITIKDLVIAHSNSVGILIDNSDHVTVESCDIIYPEQLGILSPNSGSDYNNLNNNTIEGANRSGIRTYADNSTISNNTINNTAQLKNLTKIAGDQFGQAIYVRASDCTITYNKVNKSAYSGIHFYGKNTMVKYNLIDNSMNVLGDGGAIYTYNGSNYSNTASAGSEVISNIVLNATGTREGYPKNDWDDGYGIYMDDRTHDVKVYNNTVHNCNAGIYLHIAGNIDVQHNNISDCNVMLLSSGEEQNSYIRNNVLYAFDEIDDFIWWQDDPQRFVKEDGASPIYSDNTYVNNYNDQDIFNNRGEWSSWRNDSRDASSKFITNKLNVGEKEKLFYNDTKQDKTFNLGTKTYIDIYGKQVSGSFTLKPFTSRILISSDFDQVKTENQQPSVLDHSFNFEGSILTNQSVGQVTASDPDEDQTLIYTIVGGNDNNEFTIDPNTGQITANADFDGTDNSLFNLTVKVTDNSSEPLSSTANVSISISNTEENEGSNNVADTTSPVISNFAVAANTTTLTVAIENFEASDDVSVTSYSVTETNEAPAEWSTTLPTSYTFTSEGNHTLYAWVKDAAGNISSPVSVNANVSLPVLSSDESEYRFEEGSGTTAFDTKGNADGTLINGAARTTGASGQGVELDGSSYINLGNNFGDNIQDEVSVSTWIKPTAVTGGYQGIVMHGGPNFDSFALYIHTNNKQVAFKTSGTSSSWTAVEANSLWDGNWHHIAVTYNGSEKVIYLDNTLLVKVNASGMIESGAGYNLLIGAGRDETPPTLLYTGLIDEVNVYNYGLTSQEVAELFFHVENNSADQTDKESNVDEGEQVEEEPVTDETEQAEEEPASIVNQAPVISNQAFEITQAKTTSELVGQVVASDSDADQQLTYSISAGNEEGFFTIDSNSGELFTNTAIAKNTDKIVQLSVTATDNGQSPLSTSATITVSINTVESNQRPVISNQAFEIENNYKSNKLIGQIISSDPDANQTLTYSITDGNDNDQFYIDPVTGELFTNKPLIINGNETIDLTVQVTDNGENALSANTTITINLIAKSNLVNGEVNEHNKKRITLYFSGSLHQDNNLKSAQLTSDFTVNDKVVENVTITGSEIYLDVDADFYFEDEIVVSYNKGTNPIVDDSGNEIDEFSNYIVENNLPIDDKSMTTDVNVNIDGKVEVSFYPNPSNGLFTIKADNLSNDDCSIHMYGMMGNLVAQKEVYASFGSLEEKVDMSHLSPGTYIINFICDNESTQSKLVIR